MRALSLFLSGLVSFLVSGDAVPAAPGDREALVAPPILYGRPVEDALEAPRWVSAEAFLKRPGEFRWDLFAPHDVEWLRRHFSTVDRSESLARGVVQSIDPEDCPVVTSTSSNAGARTPPYPGLLELMERAEVVIAGTIEEVTPGFLFGRPASLLTIGSLEVVPESRSSTVPDRIYAPYPEAHFALDQIPFCRWDYDDLPAVEAGEQVVLLPRAGPLDVQGSLIYATLEEMVLEAGRGRLELPKNLEVDDEMAGVMTFSELMEKIRSGADRIGARRREPGP